MKIGVLGTGVVGQTIAGKFADMGERVLLGTRDVSATLQPDSSNENRTSFLAWLHAHPNVTLVDFPRAAQESEVLFNCTSGIGSLDALGRAGSENLGSKILIDVANPLDFSQGFPPSLSVCNTSSLGEQIQSAFPSLRVVKSLNTMTASLMVQPSLIEGDHTVFLCGNDVTAKAEVSTILQKFGWKESNILDIGDITASRGTEMYLPLWLRLWGTLQNGVINIKVVS